MAEFAHLLHIRPWEVELLSVEEFEFLVKWIDSYINESKKAGGRK